MAETESPIETLKRVSGLHCIPAMHRADACKALERLEAVVLRLDDLVGDGTVEHEPSDERLAELYGRSVSTIRRCRAALAGVGKAGPTHDHAPGFPAHEHPDGRASSKDCGFEPVVMTTPDAEPTTKKEREEWGRRVSASTATLHGRIFRLIAQVEALKAESERLRDILLLGLHHGGAMHECSPDCHDWKVTARKLLEQRHD